ncbi:MAG: RNA polymerase sigma-70 factor [Prevotella sp.]|nr:RNA polymerase sigma-70 factor [Prevotella sp.]
MTGYTEHSDCGTDMATLYKRYYGRVVAFIDCVIHDRDEANSLAQDIFLKLLENKGVLDHVANVDTYLYVVSRNKALAYLRRKLKVSEVECEEEDYSPEDLALFKELSELLSKVINRMPAQRRRIFLMSRDEGLSYQEIADILSISRRTVETQIYLAMQEIRKAMFVFLLFLLYLTK